MLFSSVMQILKPSPSLPSRFSCGTRQLSKNSSPVGEASAPSFSEIGRDETPGECMSTMRALMPLYLVLGSV